MNEVEKTIAAEIQSEAPWLTRVEVEQLSHKTISVLATDRFDGQWLGVGESVDEVVEDMFMRRAEELGNEVTNRLTPKAEASIRELLEKAKIPC